MKHDQHRTGRHRLLAACLGIVLVSLCGCTSLPVDPSGTLNEVRNGSLRVGVSPNGDFVDIQGKQPTGSEIKLVGSFADRIGSRPEWVIGGEEQLVKELKEGRLDMVVGGITDKTPWVEEVGVTRPYRTVLDSQGEEQKLVVLVPPGENAFLSELEYHLDQTQEKP